MMLSIDALNLLEHSEAAEHLPGHIGVHRECRVKVDTEIPDRASSNDNICSHREGSRWDLL